MSEHIALPRIHDLAVSFGSLNHGGPNPVLASDQDSTRGKEAPPRIRNRWNVTLKKRENATHIRNYDVGSIGNRNLRREVVEKFDLVRAIVCRGNFPRNLDHIARLNRIHTLG